MNTKARNPKPSKPNSQLVIKRYNELMGKMKAGTLTKNERRELLELMSTIADTYMGTGPKQGNSQQQKQKREEGAAFFTDPFGLLEDRPATCWFSSLLDSWWLPVRGWTVFGRCLWLVCLVFVCYCAFWLFDQIEVLF